MGGGGIGGVVDGVGRGGGFLLLGSVRPMIPCLFSFCVGWRAGSWPGICWGRLIEEDDDGGDYIPSEQALRWEGSEMGLEVSISAAFLASSLSLRKDCMGLRRAGCLVDGAIQYFLE